MRIGCPKEIKTDERRVALTPEGVAELVGRGHDALIETGAGLGAGFSDEAYRAAGARIQPDAETVFAEAELIIKVKEPLAEEYALLQPEHVIFTYLHLAPDARLTEALRRSGATAIAYETVTEPGGGLPLLRPMSLIAGRLAAQAGASALESVHGGRGVLLGGAPGVLPGRVLVIGAGVVGFNAAQVAIGMGADVTVLDKSPAALERIALRMGDRCKTLAAGRAALSERLPEADLVIGAALTPGAKAPTLIDRAMLAAMQPGAVLVDVAIDQGGCFETSRPTTHSDPIYILDGIVHYAVANMPGAVARSSTYALTNATLPYVAALADNGWRGALRSNEGLAAGLAIWRGGVVCGAVAEAQGVSVTPLREALEA